MITSGETWCFARWKFFLRYLKKIPIRLHYHFILSNVSGFNSVDLTLMWTEIAPTCQNPISWSNQRESFPALHLEFEGLRQTRRWRSHLHFFVTPANFRNYRCSSDIQYRIQWWQSQIMRWWQDAPSASESSWHFLSTTLSFCCPRTKILSEENKIKSTSIQQNT